MAHRHFARGTSTFPCTICKRTTRMTTQNDDRYCGECNTLLETQNGLFDDGEAFFVAGGGPAYRDKFLAKIIRLGGDGAAVKAEMPRLFAA